MCHFVAYYGMKQSSLWDFLYSKKINNDYILKQNEWLKKYKKYLEAEKREQIIDLGCGEGGNAIYLHGMGYRVIACDFSQVVLNRIKREHPDIETKNFDMVEGIPFESNSIGIVISNLSTHYFSSEQTKKIYSDIYRCLKPGGYFIYRVNSNDEYERNKNNIITRLEDEYYLTRNGKRKRYFSVDSMARFLTDFVILENFKTELDFNGVKKYAIEGIAQKELCSSSYIHS